MNFETSSLYFKINKQINKTKKVRKNLNNNSKQGQFTWQSTVHFNLSSKWSVILVIISTFFKVFYADKPILHSAHMSPIC